MGKERIELMAGTLEGGKKAAAKNKAKYGDDFYARIGHKGGAEALLVDSLASKSAKTA